MLIPEARTATQRQNHGYLMDVIVMTQRFLLSLGR